MGQLTKSEGSRTMETSQRYLTSDEVIAALKGAKERCARYWAMVLIAYRHGTRASGV
jgi:hypothetical protein